MPVFFARSEPDHVAGMNFFDRSAPMLSEAGACGDDQSLAERVSVPSSASAGLESDAGAASARGIGRFEERIDANGAGEPVGGAFGGRLRAGFFDFHFKSSLAFFFFCLSRLAYCGVATRDGDCLRFQEDVVGGCGP